MEIKSKTEYIDMGIAISNLIRSTLGIRGMNKMVVKDNEIIMTNDGATIIKNVKSENPIMEIFQKLATAQENRIGDGTTTCVILAGQLLEKSKELMNKGIHKTTIINGYNLAKMETLRFLNSIKEKGDKKQIIKTTFGSKISPDQVELLSNIMLNINPNKMRLHKIPNSNSNDTKQLKGFAFDGFTINDRMPNEVEGKVAILDIRSNVELTKFQITNSEELEKINQVDNSHRDKILNKLIENDVKIVFYTDTNPEFESLLTEKGMMGIVVYKREFLDSIAKASQTTVTSNIDRLKVGYGNVKFVKDDKTIYLENKDSEIDTIVLKGSTEQVLEETARALDDVIKLLRVGEDVVMGAGAVEIEVALHLNNYAKEVGGKEQLAIIKFAEAIESIPLIIAENCGLDAIEIVTNLKTMHNLGKKDWGVDLYKFASDSRERGIIEPVVSKMYSMSSATDVTNLILKLDDIYNGK